MRQFEIHALQVGRGIVGLSPLPGRAGGYSDDLAVIQDWQPDLVISMTTEIEMLQEGAGEFDTDLEQSGIQWVHLPVEDFGAPPPQITELWSRVSQTVAHILSQQGRILVHCRGGCGRSGMIALRIMVEGGEAPESALSRLRAVRPCAVETDGQMAWAAQAAQT